MKQSSFSLEGFEITSFGNGTSYTVKRKALSFHVQGDDAAKFQEELEIAMGSTGPYGAREFLGDMMEAIGRADDE